MQSVAAKLLAYLRSPLVPRSTRELAARLLPVLAVAILAAVGLVHAFSPGGLTTSELMMHLLTIWLGFLAGMLLAGYVVLRVLSSRALPPSVGVLWLISSLGFVFGLVVVAGLDSIGSLFTDAAAKAASLHGPQSMLLRLLPVWALVTAYIVRSEMLDAYESRFGELRFQVPGASQEAGSSVVVLGSGESPVEVDIANLVAVSAEENYCHVVTLQDGASHGELVRATLQSVEQLLPTDRFLRVHRSHLVNVEYVERIHRSGRQFFIEIRHREGRMPIARSRVATVLARLEP